MYVKIFMLPWKKCVFLHLNVESSSFKKNGPFEIHHNEILLAQWKYVYFQVFPEIRNISKILTLKCLYESKGPRKKIQL